MINIDLINSYITPISKFYVDLIKFEVNRFGREEVYNIQLKQLDCTRITEDGIRIQQTIGIPYASELTQMIYLIDTYFKDDEDNRLQQVLDIHKRNIEFEKENPPIIYKSKSKTAKAKTSKPKQTRMKFDDNGEPVKTVAERKLAVKAIKMNSLKFNLKPV